MQSGHIGIVSRAIFEHVSKNLIKWKMVSAAFWQAILFKPAILVIGNGTSFFKCLFCMLKKYINHMPTLVMANLNSRSSVSDHESV